MNVFSVVGRLTKDVEIRKTNSGNKVARVSLAENIWTDGEEQTLFHDLTFFLPLSERIEKIGTKGTMITAYGKLRYRDVPDKQTGVRRRYYEVLVDGFDLVNTGKKIDKTKEKNEALKVNAPEVEHEEIPF